MCTCFSALRIDISVLNCVNVMLPRSFLCKPNFVDATLVTQRPGKHGRTLDMTAASPTRHPSPPATKIPLLTLNRPDLARRQPCRLLWFREEKAQRGTDNLLITRPNIFQRLSWAEDEIDGAWLVRGSIVRAWSASSAGGSAKDGQQIA